MKSAPSEQLKNLLSLSSFVLRFELTYLHGTDSELLHMFTLIRRFRYIIFGSLATACGSLACGWCVQYLASQSGWDIIQAYRAVFWVYACVGFIKFLLALCLSDKCEAPEEVDVDEPIAAVETEPLLADSGEVAQSPQPERQPQKKANKSAITQMSKHTWKVLFGLLPLFAVDSFASGLVPL